MHIERGDLMTGPDQRPQRLATDRAEGAGEQDPASCGHRLAPRYDLVGPSYLLAFSAGLNDVPTATPRDRISSRGSGCRRSIHGAAPGSVSWPSGAGQVQSSSLLWFDETLAADPVGDIASFTGPVLIIWGEAEQIIPYGEVEAYLAATEGSAASTELVTIPEADHGDGFYSDQPEVDAMLHAALVEFFGSALGEG